MRLRLILQFQFQMVYAKGVFYLFVLFSHSGIGYSIHDVCIRFTCNHTFHADDLCLMAPCAIA